MGVPLLNFNFVQQMFVLPFHDKQESRKGVRGFCSLSFINSVPWPPKQFLLSFEHIVYMRLYTGYLALSIGWIFRTFLHLPFASSRHIFKLILLSLDFFCALSCPDSCTSQGSFFISSCSSKKKFSKKAGFLRIHYLKCDMMGNIHP